MRTPINELGTYNATANVLAQDGVPASGSGQVTVIGADGTCPP